MDSSKLLPHPSKWNHRSFWSQPPGSFKGCCLLHTSRDPHLALNKTLVLVLLPSVGRSLQPSTPPPLSKAACNQHIHPRPPHIHFRPPHIHPRPPHIRSRPPRMHSRPTKPSTHPLPPFGTTSCAGRLLQRPQDTPWRVPHPGTCAVVSSQPIAGRDGLSDASATPPACS